MTDAKFYLMHENKNILLPENIRQLQIHKVDQGHKWPGDVVWKDSRAAKNQRYWGISSVLHQYTAENLGSIIWDR